MQSNILLKVVNISKVYQTKNGIINALSGVNLNIHKGEIISLLGPNGAGKTTLSSILATLHPPTKGDILFNGVSIYKDISNYRRNLGFCPQKPNLDPFLNIEENLIFAGRYFLLSESEIQKKVPELLKQFHIEKYAKSEIKSLSGGTKQRVLIARALIHNPEIVIFDEPTVGLDPDIRRQLWQIIKDLAKKGISIILTTHYLDEAEELSDRICILNKGKIVLTEKLSELKAKHKDKNLEDLFLHLLERENLDEQF